MRKKRKSFICAILAVLMFACLSGTPAQAASGKALYQKAVSYYKKGKYSPAGKCFSKLPEKANEACVKKMPAKMKKAYRDIVKKCRVSYNLFNMKPYLWGYYLTDIDKDKAPELLIQYGTCEADVRMLVYTYKSGKAKKIGTFYCSHSGFYYFPLGNGLMVQKGHMGYEQLFLVQIKKNKLVSKEIGKGHEMQQYTPIPYCLDYHIKYDSNYNRRVDYSPLK